jgi:predicted aspartyl protease
MSQALVSSHFPYLPLHLTVGPVTLDVEALLDTGFDGDVAMPANLAVDGTTPAGYMTCRLADGSPVAAPVYRATVEVGSFGPFQIYVIVLGDEPLVGRGVSDRLRITLDHGQRLLVEP